MTMGALMMGNLLQAPVFFRKVLPRNHPTSEYQNFEAHSFECLKLEIFFVSSRFFKTLIQSTESAWNEGSKKRASDLQPWGLVIERV